MVPVYKINKGGLTAALLILLLLTGTSCSSTSANVVFTVDGQAIGLAEYTQQLDKEKLMVISDFQRKYQASYDIDFWTTDFKGFRPEEVLKERAKDAIVLRSVKKALAKQMGIVQKTNYPDFLKELDSVNKARQAAVKAGQVIYGPVNYTEEMYAGYSLSLLENSVKEKMTKPGESREQVQDEYNALIQKKVNQAKININKAVYEQIKIH